MNTQCLEIDICASRAQAYRIYVGSSLLDGVGTQLAGLVSGRSACIVSDTNAAAHYLARTRSSLEQAGFTVFESIVEAGEQSKDISVAHSLWEDFARFGLTRNSVVCALGGGVVGDVAAFAASTFMRGIACVQIPTSLLAMVDSSVGGKTAVNLAAGKNLAGTFHQPVVVVADLDSLDSLPAPEWSNGLAEIAKSALIEGTDFTDWLSAHAHELCAHEKAVVQEAIVRSLAFKGRVVADDERESGPRECLNYGHTFAHALEAVAGYGAISHGRAVAEGMRFAARLGTEAAGVSEDFVAAQDSLLDALDLQRIKGNYAVDDLFERMCTDKKARGADLRFVFAEAPGQWRTMPVDLDLLKIYLLLWAQA
jgi:3-dehydroquinate synthase